MIDLIDVKREIVDTVVSIVGNNYNVDVDLELIGGNLEVSVSISDRITDDTINLRDNFRYEEVDGWEEKLRKKFKDRMLKTFVSVFSGRK